MGRAQRQVNSSLAAAGTQPPLPERFAHVVEEAYVTFVVDLQADKVLKAELMTKSLKHFDTGLDFKPANAQEWELLKDRAKKLAEDDPTQTLLVWSDE